jgi:hypothetical protein
MGVSLPSPFRWQVEATGPNGRDLRSEAYGPCATRYGRLSYRRGKPPPRASAAEARRE